MHVVELVVEDGGHDFTQVPSYNKYPELQEVQT